MQHSPVFLNNDHIGSINENTIIMVSKGRNIFYDSKIARKSPQFSLRTRAELLVYRYEISNDFTRNAKERFLIERSNMLIFKLYRPVVETGTRLLRNDTNFRFITCLYSQQNSSTLNELISFRFSFSLASIKLFL